MSGQRTGEDGATDIWRKYEAGRDHHNGEGMYRRVERCHRSVSYTHLDVYKRQQYAYLICDRGAAAGAGGLMAG